MSTLNLTVSTTQRQEFPSPADSYADLVDDPNNPLQYITSNVLTTIVFSLILMTAVIQTYWIKRCGAKWVMLMTIGAYTFAFGIGTRFGLHAHPESKGIYVVEYLFVVLSPCAFIAANYVLLGRLSRHLGATQQLLVDSRQITAVFISSDVTTFLIQLPVVQLAQIFLVGLALQLRSFFILTCIFLTFLWRIHAHEPHIREAGGKKCCIGILVRSVYRTTELLQGFEGRLATMEAFFYGLDMLPLFIAVAVYVPFWPGRLIPRGPVEHKA
ncbi:RTA1-like protein [Armillaria mellea]|nr:RTA1-like protein [Armillaria mellea]